MNRPAWMPATALWALPASLVLVLHAWAYRFVCDDAFISFRYARHLVEHGELAFNLGERVEGYSNFLWTIGIAAGMALGLDPVPWSQGLGLIFGVGTILRVTQFMARWERATRGASPSAWTALPGCLLAAAPSYAAWTTGGLETQLFTFCVTMAWTSYVLSSLPSHVAERVPLPGRPSLASGLWLGLAALTRPEGLIFVAALALHASLRGVERRGIIHWIGGFGLLFLPFLSWRYFYYGSWLPNTFHVKGASQELWGPGLYYAGRWAEGHGLHVVPLCIWWLVTGSSAAVRAQRGLVRLLLLTLIAHASFVIAVGGDFMMGGRYLVPVLPAIAVLVGLGFQAWRGLPWFGRNRAGEDQVAAGSARAAWTLGALSSLLLASHAYLQHGRAMRVETVRGLASIGWLDQFVDQGTTIGRWLHETQPATARMGITAAGTIPFYSELVTLDMLGLNDRWIARNVAPKGIRPGHRKRAPVDYLLDQDLDLIVRHPTITEMPSWPAAGMRDAWISRGYEWTSKRVPGLEPPWFGYWQRVP